MSAVPASARPFLRGCIICILLLAPRPALALDPAKAITQYLHEIWQTKDGLPQNTITAIAQTSDGYLWLGTRAGLIRFDGVRFTVFSSQTTPEITQDQILSLLADRQGRLWIGTWGGGLVRMDRGSFTRFSTSDGLPSDLIATIFEDRQGRLWIGTDGGGLARAEEGGSANPEMGVPQRFVTERSRDALGLSIRDILEDDGGLWIATDAGLAHLQRDGTLRSFGPAQGLSRTSVRSLLRDRAGTLWIGTDLGLNRYRDGQFTVLTKADGLSHNVIVSLVEDREGSVWIGTDGGGINRWRDGALTSFTSTLGLSNDSILSMLEDREGSLWIGTNLGGLNRLKDGRFTPFTKREGLSHDYVRAVYEDRAGTLWIGTEGGGLNRVRDGQVTSFTTKNGLSNDTVFAILEDHEGSLWIGTDNGLTRLRNGRFEVFHAEMGMSNDSVLALHEDRQGTLWIGTYAGGLNRYKDGRFTSFTTKEGLSHNTVNVIFEDRDANLWIGTRGGGLNRYQDGQFTAFTSKDGLSDDLVFALHEDAAGALWIGTYGGGLTRLKAGRFSVVSERHGLFDNVVHRIIEDGLGNVWMSGNKGISRVVKRELDEVADGSRPLLTPIVYGTADGMRNAECNGGANAGTITRAGLVWFPTIEGAVSVDPAHLTTNTVPPPVVIEEILIDGRRSRSSDDLRLPSDAQTLEVHFTALSFTAPAAVRFRYRLEGLEDDWVETEGRRTAYYSKLPPGQYSFHVIAANNDGVWNDTGATLAVSVAPRLQETIWFRGAVVLLFLLAGPLFYRFRLRRLTAQKAALERLVAERTAALEAANGLLAQLAREDGLTGLMNRRAFDSALAEECRRASRVHSPLSLLLIDIDVFKAYNDHLGHQAGDACLRAVSQAIASASRRAGELVARYGGEELAVIIPGDAPDSVTRQAELLRIRVQDLALPHPASPVAPVVTVSIGVAFNRLDGDVSPSDLIAAADRALYLAKERGRNRTEVHQQT
ncbi:MAG: two-component regulator propeller domain-containing protein [Vicinamibacterales bacterium]